MLQKHASCIIYPTLCYSEAYVALGLPLLSAGRKELTTSLFNKILQDPNHRLHHLLPPKNKCQATLRKKRTFNVPLSTTNRLNRSFFNGKFFSFLAFSSRSAILHLVLNIFKIFVPLQIAVIQPFGCNGFI